MASSQAKEETKKPEKFEISEKARKGKRKTRERSKNNEKVVLRSQAQMQLL